MRKILTTSWFAMLFLLAQSTLPTLADQAQKAEVAKSKAEVLEEKAAPDGSKKPPAPTELITKTQTQAVDPMGKKPLDDAITCLARTIYWEARGSKDSAMEAVAHVVMNRVGHEGFPNTVCGVVKQGSEQKACQFSWWCDGRPDDAKEDESYAIAKEIARKALNRQLKDITDKAMYFHHQKVAPDWSKAYIETVKIDEFVFYKPKNDKAK